MEIASELEEIEVMLCENISEFSGNESDDESDWELHTCYSPSCKKPRCVAIQTVCVDLLCQRPRCIAAHAWHCEIKFWLPFEGRSCLTKWGIIENGRYYLLHDSQLYHMGSIHDTIYMVYRARERPHWVLADLEGGDPVEKGGFLIYRSSHTLDGECDGLAEDVQLLHASLAAASPHLPFPAIPKRYRALEQSTSSAQDASGYDSDRSTSAESTDESDDGFENSLQYWMDCFGKIRG